MNDVVVDPAGGCYRVIAIDRNKCLIEDGIGDRWVLGVMRILKGSWRVGRNR